MAKKIEKYLPVDYSDSFSIEVTENRLSPRYYFKSLCS